MVETAYDYLEKLYQQKAPSQGQTKDAASAGDDDAYSFLENLYNPKEDVTAPVDVEKPRVPDAAARKLAESVGAIPQSETKAKEPFPWDNVELTPENIQKVSEKLVGALGLDRPAEPGYLQQPIQLGKNFARGAVELPFALAGEAAKLPEDIKYFRKEPLDAAKQVAVGTGKMLWEPIDRTIIQAIRDAAQGTTQVSERALEDPAGTLLDALMVGGLKSGIKPKASELPRLREGAFKAALPEEVATQVTSPASALQEKPSLPPERVFVPEGRAKTFVSDRKVLRRQPEAFDIVKESVPFERRPPESPLLQDISSRKAITRGQRVIESEVPYPEQFSARAREPVPFEQPAAREVPFKRVGEQATQAPNVSEIDALSKYAQKQARTPEQKKGRAMEIAAIKRGLEGNLTGKEFENVKKFLTNNHIGKEVMVGGQKGIVQKTSFGKTGVQFEDGTLKFVPQDQISSAPVTREAVLSHAKALAEKAFEGKKAIYEGFKYEQPQIAAQKVTQPTIPTTQAQEIAPKTALPALEAPRSIPEAPKVTMAAQPEAVAPKTTPFERTAVSEAPKPPKPDTELHSRVYERLKEENPTALTEDVTYQQMNMRKDAESAVSLLQQDKQKAYRVAMGAEELSGQTSTGVNIAMAEQALKEGNHDLYAQLVKKRSLDQTRRGQEIVAEKGSVTDNSTARYVKELVKQRMEKAGDSYLGDLKQKLKKESKAKRAVDIIDREVEKAKKQIGNKKLDIAEAQRLIDRLTCK